MRVVLRSTHGKSGLSALAAFAVLGAVPLSACSRREPPMWSGNEAPAPAKREQAVIAQADADPSTAYSSASPVPPLSPESSPPTAESGVDAGALPQTRAMPAPSSNALDARASGLFAAILGDDPSQAASFFFPLAAYEQVKDVTNPSRDWKLRLVAAYNRDIHDLHLRLGPKAARATFLGLSVPATRARWVEPGEEYNKLGYYRVFGARLRYEIDGRPHTFDIKSMISWRGEWYVVHLSQFK